MEYVVLAPVLGIGGPAKLISSGTAPDRGEQLQKPQGHALKLGAIIGSLLYYLVSVLSVPMTMVGSSGDTLVSQAEAAS